jgi:hypothetical protein
MTKRNLRHAELTDRSASGIEPIAASWADEHLGEGNRTAAQGLVCNFEQGVACAAVQRVPVVEMCDQGGAGAT